MTYVTAFRNVPSPIIGMMTVINDRQFNALEDSLDWLETTGIQVERFDPLAAPDEVARRQEVKQLLSNGKASLPLILVDGVVVLQGEHPSRSRLARLVGTARHHGRRTDRPAA